MVVRADLGPESDRDPVNAGRLRSGPGTAVPAPPGYHLVGTQWGLMNETGNYPGQAWLWLYTFWYQVQRYSTSPNVDVLIMATMGVLPLLFLLLPWIPGLHRLPRLLGVYRLI